MLPNKEGRREGSEEGRKTPQTSTEREREEPWGEGRQEKAGSTAPGGRGWRSGEVGDDSTFGIPYIWFNWPTVTYSFTQATHRQGGGERQQGRGGKTSSEWPSASQRREGRRVWKETVHRLDIRVRLTREVKTGLLSDPSPQTGRCYKKELAASSNNKVNTACLFKLTELKMLPLYIKTTSSFLQCITNNQSKPPQIFPCLNLNILNKMLIHLSSMCLSEKRKDKSSKTVIE